MSRKCQITGVGALVGNNVSHSHRVSKRRWNVNLQKVRVLVDGRAVRLNVSTQALKSGLIEKPPLTVRQRPAKEIEAQAVQQTVVEIGEEESVSQFFSATSHVDRMFKRRKGPVSPLDEGETRGKEGFEEEPGDAAGDDLGFPEE